MSVIPDGVYRITKPENQVATVIIFSAPPDPNNHILVLPDTPGPEPEWRVKNLSDGNVTIQNVATKKYLGFLGEAEVGKLCEQTHEHLEWRLQLTRHEGKYHVVVPGGAGGRPELVFDVSPLLVFPPLTALAQVRLNDPTQAWGFVAVKEAD